MKYKAGPTCGDDSPRIGVALLFSTRLGLAYLVCAKAGDMPYDSVAYFHLSNGARLERINAFANILHRGMKESAGLMANYRYIPDAFESNHEAFIHRQEISTSKQLLKDIKNMKESWSSPT